MNEKIQHGTFFGGRSLSGGRKLQFSNSSLWKPWNKRIKKSKFELIFSDFVLAIPILYLIILIKKTTRHSLFSES